MALGLYLGQSVTAKGGRKGNSPPILVAEVFRGLIQLGSQVQDVQLVVNHHCKIERSVSFLARLCQVQQSKPMGLISRYVKCSLMKVSYSAAKNLATKLQATLHERCCSAQACPKCYS